MFTGATAFDQDISEWDTGLVTDMSAMFQNATGFDQDIGSWDVSSLDNANDMFDGAGLSSRNYDALLNGWNAQTLHSGVYFDGGSSTYCNGRLAHENMDWL